MHFLELQDNMISLSVNNSRITKVVIGQNKLTFNVLAVESA